MKNISLFLTILFFMFSSCEAIVNFDENNINNEICASGQDEDGDGLTDCEDPDCRNDASCNNGETCDNQVDDDSDGFIDCNDSDCSDAPACNEIYIQTCTLSDALNTNDRYAGCGDKKCILDYMPETDSGTIKFITITGTYCENIPAQENNYFEECGGPEECPKSSICINSICIPVVDINNFNPGNFPFPINAESWNLTMEANQNQYIRIDSFFSSEFNPNNISEIGYVFPGPKQNHLNRCNIFSGFTDNSFIGDSNLNPSSFLECKVIVTGGDAIIRVEKNNQNKDVSITTGLTPTWGAKQDGEPCLTTEECATGYACTALTNSAQEGKCRQLCNSDYSCNLGQCSINAIFNYSVTTYNNVTFGICLSSSDITPMK